MNYNETAERIWETGLETDAGEAVSGHFLGWLESAILDARGHDVGEMSASDDIAVDVRLALRDELVEAVARTLAVMPENEKEA